jgi:hypothetical protein
VWDLAEDGTTAFTRFGVDNLAVFVQIYKANPNLLPRPPSETAAALTGNKSNRLVITIIGKGTFHEMII